MNKGHSRLLYKLIILIAIELTFSNAHAYRVNPSCSRPDGEIFRLVSRRIDELAANGYFQPIANSPAVLNEQLLLQFLFPVGYSDQSEIANALPIVRMYVEFPELYYSYAKACLSTEDSNGFSYKDRVLNVGFIPLPVIGAPIKHDD